MIRVASVDLLRGAVMIVMALDHTRDFFSRLRFAPEDLARSYPALFMTRWVTHFCAPIFFLLAGVGASLSLSAGRSRKQLSFFLLTRGLWLVFLELTLIHFGWWFAYQPPFILVVIWALGWSMVILSALVFLPHRAIAAMALLAIFGHNLLDGIRPESLGGLAPLWNVLHAPGLAVPGIMVGYPLIPWSAVMALGFALGDVFQWEAARRKRFLVQVGAAAVVLFVLLRYINGYGNPTPWAPQRSAAMTAVSFLNTLKYPPSLLFLLMTLGPALIALAFLERARGRVVDAISVFGRVPMFYYVTHLYVIHALATAFALWQGGEAAFLGLDTGSFPTWYGTGLPGVYLAWAIVVTILYFPCRWFARIKSTRRDWWLGYM